MKYNTPIEKALEKILPPDGSLSLSSDEVEQINRYIRNIELDRDCLDRTLSENLRHPIRFAFEICWDNFKSDIKDLF